MFHTHFKLTRRAAAGAIAVGIAIAFSSFTVVRAELDPAAKTKKSFKCSTGTACLTAASTGKTTWAVYATGTTTDAVHAITSSTNGNSGISGIATGTTGSAHGVYGQSANGDGVHGETTNTTNAGVAGISTAISGSAQGVYGQAKVGYGVEGVSSGYAFYTSNQGASGVYGLGSGRGGVGVTAETSGSQYSESREPAAILAIADKSDANIFYGENLAEKTNCIIDPGANLSCSGTITGGVVQMRQPSSTGRHVLSYSAQSASATIEDVGTARMFDGVANVQISRDFAAVMDGRWYYVFLTPLGDTSGLYVSMKSASAFQVRETERGRHSLEFDYRIVAHPLGSAGDRLPAAPNLPRRRLAGGHQ